VRDVTRWDPVSEAVSLRQMVDRLMEDSFVRPSWRSDAGRALRPPLDVYTTDEDIVILMSVPGVKPDQVEVTIEGDTVTIKGEIPAALENVDYVVQERASGPFRRLVTLNVPVEADKAEAAFKDGVLTLTIPKAEALRPRTIRVSTES